MTGFGSPCGACKFLRRKCVRGCVFAPYFCDEQGAAHFAAVHKVFGASNVSKLLSQLPVNDRSEAALTIAYQAQARLQDPVYGCVSHIFALQQQVVNLQSQLTSLKTQAALQEFATSSTSSPQEERLPYNDFNQTQASIPNQSMNIENYMMNYDNGFIESANFSESSQDCNVYSTVSGGSSSCDMKPFYSEGMDDLQSLAFSYMNHT